MSSTFQVTTASETVVIDSKRKGEASFVITNTTGRTARGHIDLKVDDERVRNWVRIEAPDRTFAPHGQEQISVDIEIPAGAPAGTVRLSLVAVSEADPDSDWTEGPGVHFTVPSSVLPAKPWLKQYWWIFVVAGVVLVTSVVLIIVLTQHKEPPTPDKPPATVSQGCEEFDCSAAAQTQMEGQSVEIERAYESLLRRKAEIELTEEMRIKVERKEVALKKEMSQLNRWRECCRSGEAAGPIAVPRLKATPESPAAAPVAAPPPAAVPLHRMDEHK